MVINLAAKHHDFGISREDFFLINETGTKNCLGCMSKLGIKKFILNGVKEFFHLTLIKINSKYFINTLMIIMPGIKSMAIPQKYWNLM